MKKIILVAVIFFAINSITTAQKKVTIGTVSTDTTALLEVSANNKGVLIPRLTNAQVFAIVSPANGLLVYNTDSAAFAYRNATAWVFLKGNATASNDWGTKGNAGTDTSKNFIGTTDDVDVVFKRNNQRAGLINQSNGNTSWGANALNPVSTSFFNTAIGGNALSLNNGSGNTANGAFALESNVNGTENTAIGAFALESNVSGTENTAIGNAAMISNKAGSNNTANGSQALRYNDGLNNTAMGWASLYTNSMGNDNTAIGASSLLNNSLGSNNTAIGYNTGSGIINGSGNVFIGSNAGGVEQGSNKLYISNSGSDANNTLIYGEFKDKLLQVNGKLKVNVPEKTVGLDLGAAAIQVSGTNPSVFTIEATAATLDIVIPNTSMANSATDILIVTHNLNGTKGMAPGVFWNGTNWLIFLESGTPHVVGEKFNVMVIKQ